MKLIEIRSKAIGQQAGNTGLFLRRLQLEKNREKKILYIGISGRPDNQQLLNMFKRHIHIIQSEFMTHICGDGAFLIRWAGLYEDLPFNGNDYEFDITKPDLFFTPDEEEEGRKLLKQMGIDEKSWFVCFHCRDSAFNCNYPGDFRNSDIKNMLKAAEYITACGGYAIRMGQKISEKLPDTGNPQIIDYATNFRTDFGDIYLSAKCKFFVGSTSGLVVIPALFNVPIVGTNFIPFASTWRTGDLFLPKKIRVVKENRFITFREFIEFSGDIRGGNIRQGVDSNIYVQNKMNSGEYIAYENTAEEILDVVMEMNERLNGTFEISEEDEQLQKKFKSLLYPDDFFYGTPIRIGAKFLRQNKDLIK